MATMVNFKKISPFDGAILCQFNNGDLFRIISLNNGVMVIEPSAGCDIYSFARNVAGCFKKGSNLYGLKAIKFEFNQASVYITEKNANPKRIIEIWEARINFNRIKEQRAREEYIKSPEYLSKHSKELKKKYRSEFVRILLEKATLNETIHFKDENAKRVWDKFVKNNSKSSYDRGVVNYAEYWAKFMQYLMTTHEGVTVQQIAANTSQIADDIEEITGFMYGCAVNILSEVWEHGDELRKWNNKKYDYAGKKTINPASLTINVE